MNLFSIFTRKKKESTPEKKAYHRKMYHKYRENNPERFRERDRKINGTGEIANPDEVMFYGYKEPLKKFQGGFGYHGVLTYSKDKGKVQCHICGRLFKSLSNHITRCHGLTAKEYKFKTGLAQTTALISEETREKMLLRPRGCNDEQLRKVQKDYIKSGKRHKKIGKPLALEIKNKRGTCPDQLLDIIDKTIKSYGRVPTVKEFLSFHNGKFLASIEKTYGSWGRALKKMNQRPRGETKQKHTKDDLIEAIKNFYEVNNRTPRWSDFNRGLLPPASSYYRDFKNLNHARLVANVPVLISVGRRVVDEWKPTEEERRKQLMRM